MKRYGPAAKMSATESGRMDVTVDPFMVLICILMVGAGSLAVTCLRADRWLGLCHLLVVYA